MNQDKHFFHIMDFCENSLSTAKDVKGVVRSFLESKGRLIVVPPFYGVSEILKEVAEDRDPQMFREDFIPFQKGLVKSLKLEGLDEYLDDQLGIFKRTFSLLCKSEEGSRVSNRCKARIIAIGADCAQVIVGAYLKSKMPSLEILEQVNTRNVVSTLSISDGFTDEVIDQVVTRGAMASTFSGFGNKRFVMSGFISGRLLPDSGNIETTLLKEEDRDFTAALAFVSLSRVFEKDSHIRVELTYVKAFDKETPSREIGIGKFLSLTEGKILSKNISRVEDLDGYLTIVDTKDVRKKAFVTLDPLVLDKIREKLLVK